MLDDKQKDLTNILDEMAQDENITSVIARLGKLLLSINSLSANETAVLWHVVEVCSISATTQESKVIIEALRTSLWARMRQIIYMESSSEKWAHEDVTHIMEIMEQNRVKKVPEQKKSWWQRILQAA